ncbi:hypothetical protein [Thermogutta sp.]|uniref:hypothetical protein n=1 Tax=Thermogutta sp. TaxID=1962930 RepID=UPI00321F7A59
MTGLLLCVAVLGLAQDPAIVGPTEVEVGRLAVFTVEGPQDVKLVWKVICPDQCPLTEKDVSIPVENNTKLVFASPVPGRYRVLAAVSYADNLYLLDAVLTVSGAVPPVPPIPPTPPNPGPNPPGPNPGPGPAPQGWTAWAKQAADELVPQPFRREEGKAIAAALRAVADEIATGKITDSRKAREAVRRSVRESLKTLESVNRWMVFSDAVDAKLDKLQQSPSLADYAAIWLAIANGLEQ